MSVVSANEFHVGRAGEDNDDFSQRSVRAWRVETDNALDDDEVLKASGLFPVLFDQHPRNSAKLARNIRFDQEESSRFWTVTVEYSTHAISGGGLDGDSGTQQDPRMRPPEVFWESVDDKKFVRFDIHGQPIVNSAWDPFSLEKRSPRAKLRVVWNQPEFDGSLAIQLVAKVNETTFAGAPKGYALCTQIGAQYRNENFIEWWVVTYEFEFDPDGWQPKEPEQGYQRVVYSTDPAIPDPTTGPTGTGTTKRERCKDSNGEDCTEPQPLDQWGRQIDAQYLPDVWYETTWEIYEYAEFNALGLPV